MSETVTILRFDAFELDTGSGELRRQGDRVKLPDNVMTPLPGSSAQWLRVSGNRTWGGNGSDADLDPFCRDQRTKVRARISGLQEPARYGQPACPICPMG